LPLPGLKLALFLLLALAHTPLQAAAAAKTRFLGTVQQAYDDVAGMLFESYFATGLADSIFLLPMLDGGSYASILPRNCNTSLQRRLEGLARSAGMAHRGVAQIDRVPAGPVPAKSAYVKVKLASMEVRGTRFSYTLSIAAPAGMAPIPGPAREFRYAGEDKAIGDFLQPRHSAGPMAWGVLGLGALALLFVVAGFSAPCRRMIGIREENRPFLHMALVLLILAGLMFIAVLFLKWKGIREASYYEGAEVHFFIDRNSGLFFSEGENNFVTIINDVIEETCDRIAHRAVGTGQPGLERKADFLIRLLNWACRKLRLPEVSLLSDLSRADYAFAVYTFQEDELKMRAEGDLSELVGNYSAMLAPALKIQEEYRNSSLIKPVSALRENLVRRAASVQKKKLFIIVFTDATEASPENVENFLSNVSDFYRSRDGYLRVFSVLFPSLPRVSGDSLIYPFEEGKVLLLSKISDFLVYLNGIERYTPDSLKRLNARLYRQTLAFRPDTGVERIYDLRLRSYAELCSRMGTDLLDIHTIARTNFLRAAFNAKPGWERPDGGAPPEAPPFFLYTHAGEDLYDIENLDSRHQQDWADPGDFNKARGRLFGGRLDQDAIRRTVEDISRTFVDQFIIIDKEPDKEELIRRIGWWLFWLTLAFSTLYSFFRYRNRFDVNHPPSRIYWAFASSWPVAILAGLLALLAYFLGGDRWSIYGNYKLATGCVLVFLVLHYLIPWLLLRGIRRPGYVSLRDTTFGFQEPAWLRRLDFILFDLAAVPAFCLALYLHILCPVLKVDMVARESSWPDQVFITWLGLTDYNRVIEVFLAASVAMGLQYLARAWIYSREVVSRFQRG
jgi:uncharacterized membrane protein YjgN (DUF898 family)